MRRENENSLGVQVQPISIEGLLKYIYLAPYLDPLPKIGRLRFGGHVEIGKGKNTRILKATWVSSEAKLGERVLVGLVIAGGPTTN